MQDFTLKTYRTLLNELLDRGYSFQTLQEFMGQPENKTVILRHDVDRKPKNAFVIASIEEEAGIRASYYFRIVKESYDEHIIKKIAEMGHEIGYHYEDLDLSSRGQWSEVGNQRSEVRDRKSSRLDTPMYHLPELQGRQVRKGLIMMHYWIKRSNLLS